MLSQTASLLRTLLLSSAGILLLAASPPALAEEAHYLKARDGDSFLMEVDGNRLDVRLIGVDCPEHGQEYGQAARDFAVEFMSHGLIDLEYDIEKYDRFNRLLAYVWHDGSQLNEELVRAGLCIPAEYKPNTKHSEQFQRAEAEARKALAGFWKQGGLKTTPKEYRKAAKK